MLISAFRQKPTVALESYARQHHKDQKIKNFLRGKNRGYNREREGDGEGERERESAFQITCYLWIESPVFINPNLQLSDNSWLGGKNHAGDWASSTWWPYNILSKTFGCKAQEFLSSFHYRLFFLCMCLLLTFSVLIHSEGSWVCSGYPS